MSKEAMKLALEALDNLMYWDNGKSDYDEARKAIKALEEALAKQEQGKNYERGFIDGMQKQAQSSVDRAVNAMVKPWSGLTDAEQSFIYDQVKQIVDSKPFWVRFADAIETKLKEKNT